MTDQQAVHAAGAGGWGLAASGKGVGTYSVGDAMAAAACPGLAQDSGKPLMVAAAARARGSGKLQWL